GEDACDCFDCFEGPSCSTRLEGEACVVVANSGTPYLFEDYWLARPRSAPLSVLPSYHIGYDAHVPRLEAAIRSLHGLVGNAVTDGREVVVGIGSTELIAAALYALSPTQDEATASVWSRAPYYSGYKQSATFFRSAGFEWAADNASSPPPATAERPLIELVTSPNNPDGHARAASVAGPHSSAVMDHAYLWPHFTAVGPPVALFTLSKMTGHASTRVGWALCSDPHVAARMRDFSACTQATFGSPRENQLRALAVLEHVVGSGGEIFTFARGRMLRRWERLEALFA
ncbi:hypothetical protein EMIHUDRAFT_53100, partial [Emiliania huxleyi CCMP1516]